MATLKYYIAFRRFKNFVCIEIGLREKELILHVNIDPDSIELEKGLTRDVRNIGHLGTGNLEIRVKNAHDLEKAKSLIIKSYEVS